MRHTILATAIALTFVTGTLQASEKPDVGPGRVAWFDITTTNVPQAKEFYGKLFDWQFNSLKGTDLAVEIVMGGKGIGTIRRSEGKIGSFNGVVYIQVTDMQAQCARVKQLGGTVVPGFPFNLSDGTGAIGLFADPSGHPMGMYSRTPLPSSPSATK